MNVRFFILNVHFLYENLVSALNFLPQGADLYLFLGGSFGQKHKTICSHALSGWGAYLNFFENVCIIRENL